MSPYCLTPHQTLYRTCNKINIRAVQGGQYSTHTKLKKVSNYTSCYNSSNFHILKYFNKNDTLLATAGGKYLDRTLQSAPSFPTVVFLTITCLSSRRIRV